MRVVKELRIGRTVYNGDLGRYDAETNAWLYPLECLLIPRIDDGDGTDSRAAQTEEMAAILRELASTGLALRINTTLSLQAGDGGVEPSMGIVLQAIGAALEQAAAPARQAVVGQEIVLGYLRDVEVP